MVLFGTVSPPCLIHHFCCLGEGLDEVHKQSEVGANTLETRIRMRQNPSVFQQKW